MSLDRSYTAMVRDKTYYTVTVTVLNLYCIFSANLLKLETRMFLYSYNNCHTSSFIVWYSFMHFIHVLFVNQFYLYKHHLTYSINFIIVVRLETHFYYRYKNCYQDIFIDTQ